MRSNFSKPTRIALNLQRLQKIRQSKAQGQPAEQKLKTGIQAQLTKDQASQHKTSYLQFIWSKGTEVIHFVTSTVSQASSYVNKLAQNMINESPSRLLPHVAQRQIDGKSYVVDEYCDRDITPAGTCNHFPNSQFKDLNAGIVTEENTRYIFPLVATALFQTTQQFANSLLYYGKNISIPFTQVTHQITHSFANVTDFFIGNCASLVIANKMLDECGTNGTKYYEIHTFQLGNTTAYIRAMGVSGNFKNFVSSFVDMIAANCFPAPSSDESSEMNTRDVFIIVGGGFVAGICLGCCIYRGIKKYQRRKLLHRNDTSPLLAMQEQSSSQGTYGTFSKYSEGRLADIPEDGGI